MAARSYAAAVAVAVAMLARPAVAAPVYHGLLRIHSAWGPIRADGTATLRVRRWVLRLGNATDGRPSNGIDPTTEPIVVSIGDQQFPVSMDQVRTSHGGTRFTYRRHGRGGVRFLRIVARPDGTYVIRMTVGGLDLSALTQDDQTCRPAAIIIGDDDGFIGLDLHHQPFRAPRFRLRGACDASGDWPWIQS